MSHPPADAVVGMMDAAYFTGRKELLDFFNDLLDLNLTKIEQTASGAIACQLTELIFPGSIVMSKVNWAAKSDYEFVQNYKLLQVAFTKHHIQRHVDVDKLIRAKYQDNLEFCQWLKAFYDQSGTFRENYDAMAVRERGKGGVRYNQSFGRRRASHAAAASKPVAGRSQLSARTMPTARTRPGTVSTTTITTGRSPAIGAATMSGPATRVTKPSTVTSSPSSPSSATSRPSRPLGTRIQQDQDDMAPSPLPQQQQPQANHLEEDDLDQMLQDKEDKESLDPAENGHVDQDDMDDKTSKSQSLETTSPHETTITDHEVVVAAAVETATKELTETNNALVEQNAELTTKVEELEQAVLEIEKERDFYFEKLRNVEVMLQVHQERDQLSNSSNSSATTSEDPDNTTLENGVGTTEVINKSIVVHLVDKIFRVLYATAEENLTVNDEGEVVDALEENESFSDNV